MSNRFAILGVTFAAVAASPAMAADANPWRVGSQAAGQMQNQVQDVATQVEPQMQNVPPQSAQVQSTQPGGVNYAPMDNSIPRTSYRIDPLMVQVPPTLTQQPYGYAPYGPSYGQGYGYPGGQVYPGSYVYGPGGYGPGFGGPGLGNLGFGGPGYGGWNGLNGLNNGPWSWMPFW